MKTKSEGIVIHVHVHVRDVHVHVYDGDKLDVLTRVPAVFVLNAAVSWLTSRCACECY